MANRTINDYTAKAPTDGDHVVWQTGSLVSGQWFKSSWLQLYNYVSGKLGALAFLNTVDTAQIEADAVDRTKIAALAIGNSELDSNAVNTPKIADDTVTSAKLAHGVAGALRAYSGTGAPADIAPGATVGHVLTSNGTGAVPTYQAVAGGGDMLKSTYDPVPSKEADMWDMDNMDEGTTNKILTQGERDKIGHLTVTQAVNLDQMEIDVAANNAKETNATHEGEVAGATTLTIANGVVTLAKMADATQGDIITFGAGGTPAYLTAGTPGQVLKTNGSGANVGWADESGGAAPADEHTANATGTINQGDLCYYNGTWNLAQANAVGTVKGLLGLAQSSVTNGQALTCTLTGTHTTTSLSAGALYYVSPSVAGGYTNVLPTGANYTRILGYALSTTELRFRPSDDYVLGG